jgi:hypothetical protein
MKILILKNRTPMKLILICLVFCSFIATPPNDVWGILSGIKYDIKFDEELDDIVFTPKPTTAIKEMNGKTITIQGYKSSIVDFKSTSPKGITLLLYRYKKEVFSCTDLGLESYIEITPKEKMNLKEGILYTFKGVFNLNAKNPQTFSFQLKEAECQVSSPK